MLDTHYTIGLVSGVLAFAANPIYVWSILQGKTRPDRVTWWIIAALNILITATSYELGARSTIWLPVAFSLSCSIIAILSVLYGEGPVQLTRLQVTCISGACLAILLWYLSGSALLTLLLTMSIDFFGIIPTIYKTYLRPHTESSAAWIIATVASALTIAAIDSWTVGIYAYPLYVFATNMLVTILILRGVPESNS